MFDTLYTQLNGTIATLGKCGNFQLVLQHPFINKYTALTKPWC